MRKSNHLIITDLEAENICLIQTDSDHILNKIIMVIFCKHNNLANRNVLVIKPNAEKGFATNSLIFPRVLFRDISDKEF